MACNVSITFSLEVFYVNVSCVGTLMFSGRRYQCAGHSETKFSHSYHHTFSLELFTTWGISAKVQKQSIHHTFILLLLLRRLRHLNHHPSSTAMAVSIAAALGRQQAPSSGQVGAAAAGLASSKAVGMVWASRAA